MLPFGNRVYKKSTASGSATERKYVVDIAGELPVILMELNGSGGIVKTYVYANSEVIAQHEGDTSADRYFYLHDRLGSVRLVIDEAGAVQNYYTYEPFGRTIESGGTLDNPFRFTGQYFDSEIEEYYLRARQYNPYISRFTSRDPVRGEFDEPITVHKYLYCANNPINYVDPTGKSLWGQVEGIMAGYSVHYGAIGFAAYGVANGNERFLTLGIELEQTILPVMAIAMVHARIKSVVQKMKDDLSEQHGDNWFGNGMVPDNAPKYIKIGILLVLLASQLDGCLQDPLEELPSREDWNNLMRGDDMQRWEKPPDDSISQ